MDQILYELKDGVIVGSVGGWRSGNMLLESFRSKFKLPCITYKL